MLLPWQQPVQNTYPSRLSQQQTTGQDLQPSLPFASSLPISQVYSFRIPQTGRSTRLQMESLITTIPSRGSPPGRSRLICVLLARYRPIPFIIKLINCLKEGSLWKEVTAPDGRAYFHHTRKLLCCEADLVWLLSVEYDGVGASGRDQEGYLAHFDYFQRLME
jgi:hypothetical protein